MNSIFNKRSKIIFISVLLIFVILFGYKKYYDFKFNEIVYMTIESLKTDESISEKFDGIEKICIQTPYMPKELFLEAGGTYLLFYEYTDSELIVHFYYTSYLSTKIKIKSKYIKYDSDLNFNNCSPSNEIFFRKVDDVIFLGFNRSNP